MSKFNQCTESDTFVSCYTGYYRVDLHDNGFILVNAQGAGIGTCEVDENKNVDCY